MADLLYQVLVVENNKEFRGGIKTTLYTGDKEQLSKDIGNFRYYDEQGNIQIGNIKDVLPSKGVELRQDFRTFLSESGKKYGARMMLVYRKLSQLIAKSWVNAETSIIDEKSVPESTLDAIIYRLTQTSNLALDEYITSDAKGLTELYDIAKDTIKSVRNDNDSSQWSTIILPDSVNWQYIRLSLLCAGQAYFKDKVGNYWRINEQILSTYEICVAYSFSLQAGSSIDAVTTTPDLIQYNQVQKPPYFKVTFPDLQKPSSLVELCENALRNWADAPEVGEPYPFYPPKNEEQNYTSDVVTNVVCQDIIPPPPVST